MLMPARIKRVRGWKVGALPADQARTLIVPTSDPLREPCGIKPGIRTKLAFPHIP